MTAFQSNPEAEFLAHGISAAEIAALKQGDLTLLKTELTYAELEALVRLTHTTASVMSPWPWPWPFPFLTPPPKP